MTALLTSLVVGTGTGTATAVGVSQGSVASAVPSARTPQVLDTADLDGERVLTMAEVGNRIVVGGYFAQVADASANGGRTYSRPYLFAFDPTTGAVDPNFAPVVNGQVNTVIAGPNNTVYVGGSFTSLNGASSRNLVQLSLATGQRTSSFRAPNLNGAVNSLALSGNRLFVGGQFATVGGVAHAGLATLNATTGALDPYLNIQLAQHHNYPDRGTAQSAVGATKLDITPDGSRMIVIGNFRQADGLTRDQVAMVLLQPTAAVVDPNWQTTRYSAACFSWAFDSYLRDVQFAPDGSYFVIVDTGGANTGTLCDSTTRWETNAQGQDVQPTWADFAGGDTSFSVAVTGSAVYVGGHMRWMNNSFGHDSAGAGAVPRPGLAALDPRTGVPLSWNPGRNPRGVGAQALLATSQGLYMGSDTDYIGNRQYKRPRLAFFPLANGGARPDESTGKLPANVYLAGRPVGPAPTDPADVLYRVNAGGPALAATDGGPSWAADDGTTNALRNSGSNAAGWSAVPAVDGTVPASTPSQVFDSERWDPSDATEMQWHFPVAGGTTVQVRLYLANRCTCTSSPGQRAFDVSIDGGLVLDDFDIAAAVGDQTGTMRSFTVTSDGSVDLTFGHVVENPLVNGIEIVKAGATPPPAPSGIDDVVKRWYDGTTVAADVPVDGAGMNWSKARGAFMAGNTLFYGYPDDNGAYKLYSRTFDGATFGPATVLDPYDDPYWSDIQTGSGQTYRGALPTFYSQLSSVSGMFFDKGRLYYTRNGSGQLFYRYFSVDSGVVGADEFVAIPAGFSDVSGMFLSGDQLYEVSRGTGSLSHVTFVDGVVTGSPATVSGSSIDGRDWRTPALFLGPGGPPPAPNQAPTASFSSSCVGLTCSFDGTRTTDPDGTVASYAWDFGDGTTGTGATPSHTFGSAGSYPITLTVTDDRGATNATTSSVTVTQPPAPATIGLRGSAETSARGVTSVAVTVPGGVQAGDGLVLVVSTNSTVAGSAPDGWTSAGVQTSGTSITTQVFSRVATSTDPGSIVPVGLSGSAKVTLQLLAYSGTAAGGPIASLAGAVDIGGTSHATPTASAPAGSWLLSVWSDKQAGARQWTPPASVTVRSNLAGVGSGDVATLIADSAGPVAAGQVGGLTATVPTASNRATMFTIVLAAG